MADSAPRTQAGTMTGWPRTFSSPSARIRSRMWSMDASSASEPENRGPNVSAISATRSNALLSASAAWINWRAASA